MKWVTEEICILIFVLLNYANALDEPSTPSNIGLFDKIEPNIIQVKPMTVKPPTHGGFPARNKARHVNGDQIGAILKNNSESRLIRAAILLDPPFVASFNLSNDSEQEHESNPGLVMQILKAMKKLHNFEYEFTIPPDGLWGESDDTGNWSGMFGLLQRDEVDVVAAASIVRYDRRAVAEYTYPFHSSEMGMLIRSPERYIDNRFLIVTAPFHKYVWALVALAIVVSGGIMKAMSGALRCATEVEYSFLQSIWVFFSVFVQQGLPLQPKSISCRTLLAFWWLAALTLVATFTGNMVALFAVNRSYLPFNTREEMVDKVRYDGYTVITTNTSITRLTFMQNSNLPILRTLWYEMTVNGKWINVSTFEEGIEIVKRSPNMVLLGSKETLQVYTSRDCSVTTTNGGLLPVMYAMAFKKDSYFTRLWSQEIRELIELGFITKWLKDYMHEVATGRGRRCSTGGGLTNAGDAIDVIRAQGAFWILLGGAALASTGLVAEYVIRSTIHVYRITTSSRRTQRRFHGFSTASGCPLEEGNQSTKDPANHECARSYQPRGTKLRRKRLEVDRF